MERWARTLVGYSVDVRPGDVVAITGHAEAASLMRLVAREVTAKGAYAVVLPAIEGVMVDLLREGSDAQLGYISPVERFVRTEADVVINIRAETNTRRMAAVDPSRQRFHASVRRELSEAYMQRAAEGKLDWTLTLFPTDAYAQDADMDTEAYTDFVLQACKLVRDDPVGAWQELREEQQRLIDWLEGRKQVRVTGPETDLTLSIEGRTWINSDGRRNFPSGEIFTGPIEDSVNGHIRFSFPVVTAGREIDGICLRFLNGKVVDASAVKSQEYLLEMLNTDEGARYLGEFAFGTNFDIQRFTKNILFDEKIGGTIHLAVGRGYPETGSKNASAVHWDMICDLRQGGEVTIDGELFQKDGNFVV